MGNQEADRNLLWFWFDFSLTKPDQKECVCVYIKNKNHCPNKKTNTDLVWNSWNSTNMSIHCGSSDGVKAAEVGFSEKISGPRMSQRPAFRHLLGTFAPGLRQALVYSPPPLVNVLGTFTFGKKSEHTLSNASIT